MHLRRRGNSVQIVKTQPGEDGKVASKPIGSANLKTGEINAKAAGLLTAAETQEVKDWITRHKAIEGQRREIEYRTLADTLSEMAGWIRTADPKLLGEHAEEVRDGLGRVRRSLGNALGERKQGPGEGKKAKAA